MSRLCCATDSQGLDASGRGGSGVLATEHCCCLCGRPWHVGNRVTAAEACVANSLVTDGRLVRCPHQCRCTSTTASPGCRCNCGGVACADCTLQLWHAVEVFWLFPLQLLLLETCDPGRRLPSQLLLPPVLPLPALLPSDGLKPGGRLLAPHLHDQQHETGSLPECHPYMPTCPWHCTSPHRLGGHTHTPLPDGTGLQSGGTTPLSRRCPSLPGGTTRQPLHTTSQQPTPERVHARPRGPSLAANRVLAAKVYVWGGGGHHDRGTRARVQAAAALA